MKRLSIMALALMLCCTAFAGCRRTDHKEETKPATTAQTTPAMTTPAPTTPKTTTHTTTPIVPDDNDFGDNGNNNALPGEAEGDMTPGDSARSRFRRIG